MGLTDRQLLWRVELPLALPDDPRRPADRAHDHGRARRAGVPRGRRRPRRRRSTREGLQVERRGRRRRCASLLAVGARRASCSASSAPSPPGAARARMTLAFLGRSAMRSTSSSTSARRRRRRADRRRAAAAAAAGAPRASPVVAIGIAIAIALPLGLWLGPHAAAARSSPSRIANVGRAVPSLALVVLFFALPRRSASSTSRWRSSLLAIPPILTNAYVGVRQVDPDTVDAARGMGMPGAQIVRKVELPLALPLDLRRHPDVDGQRRRHRHARPRSPACSRSATRSSTHDATATPAGSARRSSSPCSPSSPRSAFGRAARRHAGGR